MKTRTFTRILLLLLAVILGLSGLAAGGAITAQAASGDALSSYLFYVKWSGWSSGSKTFMNGWSHGAMDHWTIHCSYDNADVEDCKVCYCIEPGAETHTGKSYTEHDESWFNDNANSFNNTIDGDTVKELLGRIMQYGYTGGVDANWGTNPNGYKSEICQYIATQLLVWEVIVGERDEDFTWIEPPAGYDRIDSFMSGHPWASDLWDCYARISTSVKNHVGRPSFMAAEAADAQTVTMEWDGSKYSATLTDTNGVLDNFSFSASGGVNCSVSGNQLTLSATTAPSGPVTITTTKQATRKGLVVWYRDDYQKKISYGQPVDDPIRGYVNVEAESLGGIAGRKDLVGGYAGNVEAWRFQVATGLDFTGIVCEPISGPDGTWSTGLILEPGTYYVREAPLSEQYRDDKNNYVPDETVLTVTVEAGETTYAYQPGTDYTAQNTTKGWARAKKAVQGSTDPADLVGWVHQLSNDQEFSNIVENMVTDENGIAESHALVPGVYWVREAPMEYQTRPDKDKWVLDTSVHQITITPGGIAHAYDPDDPNDYTTLNILAGGVDGRKDLLGGDTDNLGGWKFQLTMDLSFADIVCEPISGPDGTWSTGLVLAPGTYYVREAPMDQQTRPDKDKWVLDNTVVTVVVEAGKTTHAYQTGKDYTAQNAPALGGVDGRKNLLGGDTDNLGGWKFQLTTDLSFADIVCEPISGPDGTWSTGLVLAPGTYYVREAPLDQQTRPDKNDWLLDNTVVTVIVRAGETTYAYQAGTDYTAQNIFKGQITAHKLGSEGSSLPGATLLLEWSQDGQGWQPVVKSSAVTMGGCQSEGLEDGCLTTGTTGTVTFEGLHPNLYYRLTEVKAPEGHDLSYQVVFEGKLDPAQNFELSGTVTDDIVILPMTGSYDFWLLPVAVVGLAVSVCWLMISRKRKEN